MFSVVGYDKDNDVYITYGAFRKIECAFDLIEKLSQLLKDDKLTRICSDGHKEPIDWIELYENMDTAAEKRIWASYDDITLDNDTLER